MSWNICLHGQAGSLSYEVLFDAVNVAAELHEELFPFALLGEAWAACEMAPNTAEFAELEAGARLFVRNSTVGHPIALAMVRHGRKTEAAAVVEAYVPYAADEKARAGIAQVHAELAKPAATP